MEEELIFAKDANLEQNKEGSAIELVQGDPKTVGRRLAYLTFALIVKSKIVDKR